MEIKKTQCKVCSEPKTRIHFGFYGSSKCKRWVNEEGKQWSGLTCPDCQRRRSAVNMRNLRISKSEQS